jgi:hypothetical protein
MEEMKKLLNREDHTKIVDFPFEVVPTSNKSKFLKDCLTNVFLNGK